MSGTLRRINEKDIAKIASGQVIVDLKSVVKELIENALVSSSEKCDGLGCQGNEHRYQANQLWRGSDRGE